MKLYGELERGERATGRAVCSQEQCGARLPELIPCKTLLALTSKAGVNPLVRKSRAREETRGDQLIQGKDPKSLRRFTDGTLFVGSSGSCCTGFAAGCIGTAGTLLAQLL
jgi:hypothetical protein